MDGRDRRGNREPRKAAGASPGEEGREQAPALEMSGAVSRERGRATEPARWQVLLLRRGGRRRCRLRRCVRGNGACWRSARWRGVRGSGLQRDADFARGVLISRELEIDLIGVDGLFDAIFGDVVQFVSGEPMIGSMANVVPSFR